MAVKEPKYLVNPKTGCWEWQLSQTTKGYGKLRHEGRTRQAHIVYFELECGAVPKGRVLDHLCKNKVCVNPAHLEPVLHQVNVQRAGKLTPQKVNEIRSWYRTGATQTQIAEYFGVGQGHVSRIISLKTWQNV